MNLIRSMVYKLISVECNRKILKNNTYLNIPNASLNKIIGYNKKIIILISLKHISLTEKKTKYLLCMYIFKELSIPNAMHPFI